MNSKQKCVWKGQSGRNYEFTIFPIDTSFNDNQDGNYIFARQIANRWEAVYIGQGDIKERVASHLLEGCVTRKGSTHIHAHLNPNEDNRRFEESDLLAYHTEAYEPNGCNERIGG